MSAFLYTTLLQWKLDLRSKEIIVTYYVVPLIFFLFVGGIFCSIMPDAYKTLIQSMTIFGVTMGSLLGAPAPLTELYGSDIIKAYQVGGVPTNIIVYFASLLLTITASLGIGTLLGLFIKNSSKMALLSQFVFLPSLMLSGIMFPVDMLPKALQYVGKLFPATWGYQLMCSDTFELSFAIPLLIIIGVCFAVSCLRLVRQK